MANDVQELWKEIERLKHALSNTVRFGRVQKNEKGETQALIGQNPDGKAVYAAIGRVAQHSGFVSDNTPMAEGQAVAILALDPDGVQTITIPMGDNDYHPKGGNVGDDKVTRRIRKPPEKKEGEGQKQSSGTPGSLSEGAEAPKDPPKMQDDDENDWIEEHGYNTKKFRKGKLVHEFGKDENGKEFSKTTIDKVTHHVTADGYTLEVDGTKYEFTKAGFKQTGGKQTHDGKNVGAGHVHGGVMKGGDKTANPEPDA